MEREDYNWNFPKDKQIQNMPNKFIPKLKQCQYEQIFHSGNENFSL
jgi:hypothetical protein